VADNDISEAKHPGAFAPEFLFVEPAATQSALMRIRLDAISLDAISLDAISLAHCAP
jgi:hypothetical protein